MIDAQFQTGDIVVFSPRVSTVYTSLRSNQPLEAISVLGKSAIVVADLGGMTRRYVYDMFDCRSTHDPQFLDSKFYSGVFWCLLMGDLSPSTQFIFVS